MKMLILSFGFFIGWKKKSGYRSCHGHALEAKRPVFSLSGNVALLAARSSSPARISTKEQKEDPTNISVLLHNHNKSKLLLIESVVMIKTCQLLSSLL